MANRQFYQFSYQAEANVVTLYMKVLIGAAGAPTLVANQNKAIKSIVLNTTGNYTINLSDNYSRLIACDVDYLNATAPAAPQSFVSADNTPSTTAPSIVLQFINNAAAATAPAPGETLLITIVLKNSSI